MVGRSVCTDQVGMASMVSQRIPDLETGCLLHGAGFLPAGRGLILSVGRVESQADSSVSTPAQEGSVTFHVKGPERVLHHSLSL